MESRGRPAVGVLGDFYDPAGQRLLSEQAEVIFLDQVDLSAVADRLRGIIPRYPSQVTAEMIAGCPNLLGIAASGRGVDNIDVDAATRAGVPVANNQGLGGASVAEHTMGMMLALTRGYRRPLAEGLLASWPTRLDIRRVELAGRTLGIVGCGKVGSEVARRAAFGFGMRVQAYDPYVDAQHMASVGAQRIEDFDALLASSDVITLHPELNHETTGMFGDREFALMKPDAYFLNISRGKVVQTEALIRALQAGRPYAAALDVYDPEPPAADSPLLTLPNVVLSPHVADMTVETMRELALSTARQMCQLLAGKRPDNLVNPQAWDAFEARHAASGLAA
jgi:D-3-phosphoglycerate dehydrogenase / 2-oxoglutarate reductase